MKLNYRILTILLSVIFLFNCSNNKIKIEKNTYLLDWDELPYHNCTTEEIINQLGNPEKVDSFMIYDYDSTKLSPICRPLIRFIPHNSNSVYIKQLIWIQDSFQIYYWFLKDRNSWYSKDGILFDPNHVEF